MEYKLFVYAGIILITIYVALRIAGQWAIKKLIKAELDYVVYSDEHKVKGRYDE